MKILQKYIKKTKKNIQRTAIIGLKKTVNDIYQNLCTCIQNHCVSKDELLVVQQMIEAKVNKEELDVLLL